jgi:hypothetical protein
LRCGLRGQDLDLRPLGHEPHEAQRLSRGQTGKSHCYSTSYSHRRRSTRPQVSPVFAACRRTGLRTDLARSARELTVGPTAGPRRSRATRAQQTIAQRACWTRCLSFLVRLQTHPSSTLDRPRRGRSADAGACLDGSLPQRGQLLVLWPELAGARLRTREGVSHPKFRLAAARMCSGDPRRLCIGTRINSACRTMRLLPTERRAVVASRTPRRDATRPDLSTVDTVHRLL